MWWAKWNPFCIFGMKQWSQQKRQDLDSFTWTSSKEQSFPTISSREKTDETQKLGWERMKLPCTEKVDEELCRSCLRRNANALFYSKPCLASFLFLLTQVQFFISWHRKRCLLYWQLKAWSDQLISVLKIFWTKCKRMGFSLSKHVVLMINFYLFKHLTEDQMSLLMANLNQSLFCPVKFQAHLWKLFWELYFSTRGYVCQIRKFQLLLLNLLRNPWSLKFRKQIFAGLWIIMVLSFFPNFFTYFLN